MSYYLYILASRHHKHITVGVTVDLVEGVRSHRRLLNRQLNRKRVWQKLVYFELLNSVDEAVEREIQLKRASRPCLDRLIERVNPGWDSISLSELEHRGQVNHEIR